MKEAKLLQSQGDNKMKELEYKIKNAKALKEKELKVMRFLDQDSVLEVVPKIANGRKIDKRNSLLGSRFLVF